MRFIPTSGATLSSVDQEYGLRMQIIFLMAPATPCSSPARLLYSASVEVRLMNFILMGGEKY